MGSIIYICRLRLPIVNKQLSHTHITNYMTKAYIFISICSSIGKMNTYTTCINAPIAHQQMQHTNNNPLVHKRAHVAIIHLFRYIYIFIYAKGDRTCRRTGAYIIFVLTWITKAHLVWGHYRNPSFRHHNNALSLSHWRYNNPKRFHCIKCTLFMYTFIANAIISPYDIWL